MARATRTSSTIPFAVEQAQLIDPSAFRFSTADAEAMKQVGGVLFELGKRELAAKNSLAVNAAVESRRLAKLKMQEFIKNNPDPDTWSMGAFDIINEQGTTFSQQRFNSKTLKKQDVEQQAFKDQLNMEVGIAAAAQNIENDIAISGKNVIDVFSEDDGTPEAAKNIQDAIERLQKAYERKYEKKIAAIHLEETLKEAKNQQIENVKKGIMNLAAVNPEQVKANINAELKARRKGKKVSQEFVLLSNIDLEAIRDYADSVGDKIDSDSKVAVNAAIENSYSKIINGDTDVISMIIAIQTDPTISDDDSNNAVVKIKTFFSTWNSAIDAKIVTSDSTRIKALKIISSVRTADITEDEGLTQYIKLSKTEKINGIDGKGFINDIFTASKSAEKDPLSTNRAKIYFGNLETLYKDVEIDALEFDKMHTVLREFFDQVPPPTPEQASKFYSELISPTVSSWLDDVFGFYKEYYKYISGYKGYEEVRKRLRGEPKEGEEDLTGMTDEELEAIIRGK